MKEIANVISHSGGWVMCETAKKYVFESKLQMEKKGQFLDKLALLIGMAPRAILSAKLV